MKQIDIVIGANFGDEGKGRTVDVLAEEGGVKTDSGFRSVVVRHNSGHQAGHTVTRNGKRHVFSHFGSATLLGAQTALCHKFVASPIAFNREWDVLVNNCKIQYPRVLCDQGVQVSTPLDALLNQCTEAGRKNKRHGSCGAGFGETIARGEYDSSLWLNAAEEMSYTKKKMLLEYFKLKFKQRNLHNVHDVMHHPKYEAVLEAIFEDRFNWSHFEEEMHLFQTRVKFFNDIGAMLNPFDHIIFEGAQGLLLDQDHPQFFPHVTRSRTGLADVAEVLQEFYIEESKIDVYFCSRAYITRHGAGPMGVGVKELTLYDMQELGYNIVDPTNEPNEWQGRLRFAELDFGDLFARTLTERLNFEEKLRMRVGSHLSLNCVDQAPNELRMKLVRRAKRYYQSVLVGIGPNGFSTVRVKDSSATADEAARIELAM